MTKSYSKSKRGAAAPDPAAPPALLDPADVWSGKVNQNDVPAAERPCFAFGCPLLGTITDSVLAGPGARWFCRYHSTAAAADWGEITRRIRMGGLEPAAARSDGADEAARERAAIQAEGRGL